MTPHLRARDEVSAAERDEMFALLDTHFENVSREQFETDLAAKNWAILLRDTAGELVGFSTFHFHHALYRGERRSVVYSGDTIVDPRCWHTPALPKAWIASVRVVHEQSGGGPLWWLLISSGFRTYRLLPVFWREFFPRHDAPEPNEIATWRHQLADERFGACYDRRAGVVRFAKPQNLKAHLGGIPIGKLADPHVAFFARANPCHAQGDELVCITRLDDANLTPAGRRMVAPSRITEAGFAHG